MKFTYITVTIDEWPRPQLEVVADARRVEVVVVVMVVMVMMVVMCSGSGGGGGGGGMVGWVVSPCDGVSVMGGVRPSVV